ncbi:hypothetical protein [Falsiroseomonas oryzae]|uniref:hypothetical protein n=1 Tax=Falsiroseomonas oryzae TaxID=2766473 RepID=UPI0022EB986A|nr:hypothetical protein [Roseomonas sp. MO-31]
MQGVFYLAMLVAVAWLCAWVAYPDIVRRYPSPFDMAGDDPVPDTRTGYQRRIPPGRDKAAPAPAADVQHAVSKRRPAESWRVRGEQAEASRPKWRS